jgi:hypothetical protein
MKFLFGELDGKRIAYDDSTIFLIQSRLKTSHKGYTTKAKVIGSLQIAVFKYNSLNISERYRKRLYVESFNNPVLCRSE